MLFGYTFKRVLVLTIAIFLLCLSVLSFLSATHSNIFSSPSANPFSLTKNSDQSHLKEKAREMLSRLEFMTFASERNKTNKILADSLKRLINLTPFDGSLWRQLLFVGGGNTSSIDNRDEILRTASKLVKWNSREHVVLVLSCIKQPLLVSTGWFDTCTDLLSNFPTSGPAVSLLRSMGISDQARLEAMTRYGVMQPIQG